MGGSQFRRSWAGELRTVAMASTTGRWQNATLGWT